MRFRESDIQRLIETLDRPIQSDDAQIVVPELGIKNLNN